MGKLKKEKKSWQKYLGKDLKVNLSLPVYAEKTTLAPFGYHGTCDAKLFNFWLEKMLAPNLKPGQTVIMDNASIHKTNTTQSIIEQAGCKPPYSPDLNPIEHLWANTKRKLFYSLPNFPSILNALCASFL